VNELFHLDYETRSCIALDERGLHNYLTDPSTQVLMAAYAEGNNKVQLWQPHLGPMPNELRDALTDPWVTIAAWNVGFERGISKFVQKIDKPICEWIDPSVFAKYQSMPGSLGEVSKIMGLGENEAKDKEGDRLIRLFCSPAIEASDGGLFGSTPAGFRDWSTDPEDWEKFCDYCRQDVVSERTILKKLMKFPLPPQEQLNWELDQLINERGITVEMSLVNGARVISDREMAKQKTILKQITKLENPNSTDQMLPWLNGQGYTFQSLGKAFVARALAGECELTPDGREALRIRTITAKSSVNKFNAIQANVSSDGRLRHQFNFMGAARTARWCLAENSLVRVKTAEGEVTDKPIQSVLITDEVWDGENWVHHEGVVFSGDKKVIEWDGLVATKNHIVWVSASEKMTLAEAKLNNRKLWKGEGKCL
jgi:DNA polymerase